MTASNDNRRVPPVIQPHQYDHLIPVANRALKSTVKATVKVMWFLLSAAFRIPGMVKRHYEEKNNRETFKRNKP